MTVRPGNLCLVVQEKACVCFDARGYKRNGKEFKVFWMPNTAILARHLIREWKSIEKMDLVEGEGVQDAAFQFDKSRTLGYLAKIRAWSRSRPPRAEPKRF